MHIASTFGDHCDVAVTADDLIAFAKTWPCFGEQSAPLHWRGAALLFTFDRRGDLVDVQGDEGLNEQGVAALADDAKTFAAAAGELVD